LTPYADSSFIVSLYLPQQSTARAIAFLQRYSQSLPFNPWHRLEVRNAIRLAVFHGLIEAAQAKQQLKQIDADINDAALLKHTAIDWTDVLREAEKLGATHNQTIGCRSADLFHVATARQTGCDTFLTFDKKQAAMATRVGMTVKP
jgi:predicted nucleic acid-binding protein